MPDVRVKAGVALAVAATALTVAMSGGASAVTTASPVGPSVRLGHAPALPAGAHVTKALPSSQVIDATVTLAPPDPGGLSAYATAVSTPGSALYRDYLTVPEFAARFAPSASAIAAVRTTLAGDGLSPSAVSANHLAIKIRGTTSAFAKGFSTGFQQVALASGRVAYRNTSAPRLPASIASSVQAVVGLDNLALPHPVSVPKASATAAATTAGTPTTPHVVTGGPQPCAAATTVRDAYSADELASAYGLSSLFGDNDLGAGQTIGFFEFSTAAASDISAYQTCYGTTTSVVNVSVDGGETTGFAEDEAALDIETAITAAPGADQLVYTGPESEAGFVDIYNQMVSDDEATVISTSYGDCEPDETEDFGGTWYRSENTIFEEAATQGQSVVDASGDDGSEDCGPYDGSARTSLAVDDPADQPFVTVVGGTSLSGATSTPTETTWNNSIGASGGGVSSVFPMPDYQAGAPSGVHVINSGSSGVPCGAVTGSYCRETPDVSMDADPDTGYAVYDDSAWEDAGGTSAAAPLLGSILALANASTACDGKAVGFVNPALYTIAGTSSYASVFNDITTGNNDWYASHTPAEYPAATGYDEATGLGSVHAGPLAAALCAFTPPAAPTLSGKPSAATVGTAYHFGFAKSGASSLTVTTGSLPSGLTLSSAGVLSGTPTKAGSFGFTVTAKNTEGHASDVVTMTVSGSDDLALTPSKPPKGRLQAAFTETATVVNGGPSPASFTVTEVVPAGLKVKSAPGAKITRKGGKTTLVWKVGSLAKSAKSKHVAKLTVTVHKNTSVRLTAKVASSLYRDPKSTNNSATQTLKLK